MEAIANTKNVFITARKARLVADLIRLKSIVDAKAILQVTNKRAAKQVMMKLLHSAIANAVNNNGMDTENLYIKKIVVDEGPTFKRFRPGGHGRAFPRLKRTSHITLTLSNVTDNNS